MLIYQSLSEQHTYKSLHQHIIHDILIVLSSLFNK